MCEPPSYNNQYIFYNYFVCAPKIEENDWNQLIILIITFIIYCRYVNLY
jgi:hypothetical protein